MHFISAPQNTNVFNLIPLFIDEVWHPSIGLAFTDPLTFSIADAHHDRHLCCDTVQTYYVRFNSHQKFYLFIICMR